VVWIVEVVLVVVLVMWCVVCFVGVISSMLRFLFVVVV